MARAPGRRSGGRDRDRVLAASAQPQLRGARRVRRPRHADALQHRAQGPQGSAEARPFPPRPIRR